MAGFFEENKGKRSMIRLLSFMMLIFAFAITAYQVRTNNVQIELNIIMYAFAFVPKLFQKILENSASKTERKQKDE